MRRCLQLAAKGLGYAAPNPIVGAVLVHENRIIGEGWHRQYGGPHAEVNCLASVVQNDEPLISQSTLYISLEPCSHTGKTPPCTNLIIKHQIPRVVIGCTDPFEKVNGTGIARLRQAGIEVITDILQRECRYTNRRFFTVQLQRRPFIILKWAQTVNGKTGTDTKQRLLISNEITNRLVHRWRSEEAAILVGSRTALADNPQLNNRLWTGPHPLRVVVDRHLQLPNHLHIFNRQQNTVVLNGVKDADGNGLQYRKLPTGNDAAAGILQALHTMHVQSVLVEGGATLLQMFIDSGLWDEARVITNTALLVNGGTDAPRLPGCTPSGTETLLTDRVDYFVNSKTSSL